MISIIDNMLPTDLANIVIKYDVQTKYDNVLTEYKKIFRVDFEITKEIAYMECNGCNTKKWGDRSKWGKCKGRHNEFHIACGKIVCNECCSKYDSQSKEEWKLTEIEFHFKNHYNMNVRCNHCDQLDQDVMDIDYDDGYDTEVIEYDEDFDEDMLQDEDFVENMKYRDDCQSSEYMFGGSAW